MDGKGFVLFAIIAPKGFLSVRQYNWYAFFAPLSFDPPSQELLMMWTIDLSTLVATCPASTTTLAQQEENNHPGGRGGARRSRYYDAVLTVLQAW